ncbi:Lysophospholipase 1 [Bacidia gigantensis]|uniref:Lysophospholipase 1 n=1 Tax=Bacidia gigantensis TaxID=2732470 RepID=UPI001D052C98|nr:Lysophospholipase 1 [Bacidia gigantensis]KAG8533168.1 Lysophospholipase 1 [Bacidia gigantensis]
MKILTASLEIFVLLSTLAGTTCSIHLIPSSQQIQSQHLAAESLHARAFGVAPNGYAPKGATCPSTRPSIRSAAELSTNETEWLEKRRNNTVQPMADFLHRMNIPGFDASSYINNNKQNATALPNIAIAASGGGYRALLNGAGALKAFDSREVDGLTDGHLGGLLQSATYLAGLSGGGWLVGSVFVNNFSTISSLQNENTGSVWEFGNSIFKGPDKGSIQLLDSAQYYDNVADTVDDKKNAGFNTSVTDYWSRALSFQLVNVTDGGPAYTWSSIQQQDSFSSGQSPMPVLVADARAPGEKLLSGNTTVYEFNPFEMGTWDPTTFGFVPLEYLGSNFSNGSLPDGQDCVRGMDNAAFVMGTSSSLFNQFLLQVNGTDVPDLAKKLITKILNTLGNDDNDIADYSPNPFFGFHNETSPNSRTQRLTLVDGGEDLQNIPLHPLIQPHRNVDVIFAVDSSADTDNFWPNGTSLVATYERSHSQEISNGTAFPAVPDVNSFVNLGLNNRPTFFGCNSSNTSSMTPLIVYLPNSPYVFQSNFSTFTASYNTSTRNAMVQNGYESATQGNGTIDRQWPTCVGCAVLSRSLERTNTQMPDACRDCFQRYCWDGRTDSRQPSAAYEPPFKGASIKVSAGEHAFERKNLVAAAAVVVLGVIVGV